MVTPSDHDARPVRADGGVGGAGDSRRTPDPEPTNPGNSPAGGDAWGDDGDAGGEAIVRFSLWATAVFAVTSALAAAVPDTFSVVSVPVALGLFVIGSVALAWGFVVGIARSQYEAVTLGGLFFLGEGVAPDRVRRTLRALLAVQVVVAVAAAAARPFTELAFGVLAPTLGLGALALWGARHGRFAPKEPDAGGRPRPAQGR
jgi:hypothetical protein